MPAVLVETAYITNQEDHDRLKSDEFRTNTAIGITEGIKQALDILEVFEYEGIFMSSRNRLRITTALMPRNASSSLEN